MTNLFGRSPIRRPALPKILEDFMEVETIKEGNKKVKKFMGEFRDFAMKGNVVDLAVGVVIGTAFNGIVTALVNNIITPLLSIVIGRIDISSLVAVITPGIKGFNAITLKYGLFLQALLNFLAISFSIFIVIKVLDKLHIMEAKKAPPEPTNSEKLLEEIRDILRQNNTGRDDRPQPDDMGRTE